MKKNLDAAERGKAQAKQIQGIKNALGYALEELEFGLELLVGLHHLLCLVDAALKHFDIGKNELKIDGLDITSRVNGTLNMNDIVVFKAAYNMDYCSCFPDMA